MANNTDILSAENILKKYNGKTAVEHVSFSIKEGSSYGLLGPNGAGKTTTISIISGLIQPDEGDVRIGGHSIQQSPMEAKALMGVVPQEIALYPNISAKENLIFWGRMYGLSGGRLRERVDKVLDMVGMTDRAKDPVETYSGGMKRRVNIAAGLLHEPRLLLLDEPTVGVDPQSRRSILDTIKHLNSLGMTVLYTSHYMEEVEEMCEVVTIMDHGKIIASGTQQELKALVSDKDLVKLSTQGFPEDNGFKESLERIPQIKDVSLEENTVLITTENGNRVLADIISTVSEKGLKIESVKLEEPNLETVFLHLTGRGLRN